MDADLERHCPGAAVGGEELRAWGREDHHVHIVLTGGSWCGAKTFPSTPLGLDIPPDYVELGLACRQCHEMETAYQRRGICCADVLLVGIAIVATAVMVTVTLRW